jgi:WD40 repeat protein
MFVGYPGVRPGRSGAIMKRTLLTFVLLFVATAMNAADAAPPQRDLKAYPLPPGAASGDISPDEKLVALETGETAVVGGQSKRKELRFVRVQIYDFQKGQLLGERSFDDTQWRGHLVRFARDGRSVLAAAENVVHILTVPELREIRRIEMPMDTTSSRIALISAMEISPDGQTVAVLRPLDDKVGRIEIYGLVSGRQVSSWTTPPGWVRFSLGLTWAPDGRALYVAIPNRTPCLPASKTPDVFEFEVPSGNVRRKISTDMTTGNIAVSADGRLFAADRNCIGVFANHDPKLKVIALATGETIKTLSGRGTGLRYFVAASGDQSRFLAYSGTVKPNIDWLDATASPKFVDETFSVWNMHDYSPIVTSQNIPGLNRAEVRMSTTGRFVVVAGFTSGVYEVP